MKWHLLGMVFLIIGTQLYSAQWQHLKSDIKEEELSTHRRYSHEELLTIKHGILNKTISPDKRQHLKDLKIHRPQKLKRKIQHAPTNHSVTTFKHKHLPLQCF